MSNILILRHSMKPHLNSLWQRVRGSWVAPYLGHRAHALSALCLLRQFPKGDLIARAFASLWFGPVLRGAGASYESRMPLPYDPTATIPVDTSGANLADMHVFTWFSALMIGGGWTVAGTVTALVMDFDYFPGMADGTGTVVDKLDGTNGVITAPTVAGQAIGNVLYKDLGDNPGEIDLNPGSVRAIVTITTTAGSFVPFVVGVPKAEVPANLSRMIASS